MTGLRMKMVAGPLVVAAGVLGWLFFSPEAVGGAEADGGPFNACHGEMTTGQMPLAGHYMGHYMSNGDADGMHGPEALHHMR